MQLSTCQKWLDLKTYTKWAYLDRSLAAHRAGASGSTVSRMDNDMRGMKEPIAISAIECLLTVEEKLVPNPGIEIQEERRGNNEEPEGFPRNNASSEKPPPPAPPIRESRPETQERVEEDRKMQRGKYQGGSETRTHKGSGPDIEGRPTGKGKDMTYTDERVPIRRKVYWPCSGGRGNRGEAYRPKFESDRDNDDQYNQQKGRYWNKGEERNVIGAGI